MYKKNTSPGVRMEVFMVVDIFYVTRLDKAKAMCTLWVYFNAVGRLGYGNLLKRCFEVKDFGECKDHQGTNCLTCSGPRDCFLACLMKHLNILSLEPQGKGRTFVSGNKHLRLKQVMCIESRATALSLMVLRDFEELLYYFSRNKVQISEDTYFDEYETYFTFLQMLLVCKPQHAFELPRISAICTTCC